MTPVTAGDAVHLLPDGRALHLLPERAAWLAEAGLLLVADAHFGKGASFRRLGVPVPRGTTHANLTRLDALVDRLTGVRELVFLGDFRHAASGRAPATVQALRGLAPASCPAGRHVGTRQSRRSCGGPAGGVGDAGGGRALAACRPGLVP